MNIYVGNLPYDISNEELEGLFSGFGEIVSAKVIVDNYSGKSKGFGFVEFSAQDAGQKAIEELNGTDMKGRAIVVNEARPRKENGRG